SLCTILLDGVYLLKSEDDISLESDLPTDNITILHKDGKFSKTKLGLSGGSVGLFEGKRIGRAKNLEILAKEIKTLNQRILELQENLRVENEKLIRLKGGSQRVFIEEQRVQLNRLTNELVSVKTKQEQYQTFINNSQNRKQDIETKIASILVELEKAEPELQ